MFFFFSEIEEPTRSLSKSRSGKKEKKKHKHKHKHKHRHSHYDESGSTDKYSGEKHKSKHKRKKRSREEDEMLETKRQRTEIEDDVDSENNIHETQLDENDLEKLEAARAALRAELNGVSDDRYDALLEEQYMALESQINEYAAQQRLVSGVNEDSRDSSSKDNEFGEADYFRPEVGLAITIPGSRYRGDTRSVSDKSRKDFKSSHSRRYADFEVDRSAIRTRETVPSEAVVTADLGNLKSIAQGYANSESEEEGEVDHKNEADDFDDDLLEYAMNEVEDVPVSKDRTGTSYNEADYKSFEQEYAEIRKRREKEKERKKDKEKREKEKERARQERKERKEKEREKREKERRREESRKEKEREEKSKEKVFERQKEEKDKRSRLVQMYPCTTVKAYSSTCTVGKNCCCCFLPSCKAD